MRIEKPWGFEELIFSGEGYSFKRLFMLAGESCSLQYHVEKHETLLVHKGKLKLQVGEFAAQLDEWILGPGDTYVIEPGLIHRMTAEVDTTYFEASTSQLDDVVRLEDRYGRAGS